ncbi:MAG: phosphoglycolate phosphatase [Candidatus Eremiobacteraeota bacterium]|jgi:phosphoglycolate phosphatase|nr:phosphoglycolate phosphatase [Candidatus Eremiobacteraeota bacterium]
MRAIFFDLDGTLSDPFEGFARSIDFAFDGLGLDVPGEDELRALIGPPLQVSLRLRFGDDPALIDEIVRRFRLRYGDTGMFENVVYPGVREMLAVLGRAATLFVCTSKPQVYAVPILRRFGLHSAFANVYGSELDGTGTHKPQLLAHALAAEGLAGGGAEIALLGDRELDVAAARANGIAGWGAAWGYGTRAELEAAGAHRVFHAPHAVADALTQSPPR